MSIDKKTAIRLAEESGWQNSAILQSDLPRLERFAALVLEHERAEFKMAVLTSERNHARACYERAVRILVGIHALLYPPRTAVEGVTFEFHSPRVHEQMQALSDRIRAIPDEIAATEANGKRDS